MKHACIDNYLLLKFENKIKTIIEFSFQKEFMKGFFVLWYLIRNDLCTFCHIVFQITNIEFF